MNFFDTIAAISTPRGKGGIAVIRISGPDAAAVGDAVFSRKLSLAEPNLELHGAIYLPLPGGKRRQIDDGMAVIFRAPRSFTGEDTVEISCHGGVLVTQAVLTACFAAGARQAEAGEFTRRAFLSGKLSLDRAESLGALLEAGTLPQLTLARSGLDGRLSDGVGEVYSMLLDVSSELRADIDFPDEDVSDMTDAELYERLSEAKEKAEKLASTYSVGRAVAEGVPTVICGRTNSGKSSLFNRLAGHESAIVTDIEGTTRDILTEKVSFGGVTLNLFDTAGLRRTDDPIEKIGIGRAERAIEAAGLIFAVFDGSHEPSTEDIALAERLSKSDAKVIAVINKSDLPRAAGLDAISSRLPLTVNVSAKTGLGIEELDKTVGEIFNSEGLDIGKDAVVATARQYGALAFAGECLSEALAGIDSGLPTDLVSSSVERAMEALAGISGKRVGEDIVGSIFSKFCVGK